MSFTLIRRKDGKEIPIKVSILDAFRSAPPRRPKAVQPEKSDNETSAATKNETSPKPAAETNANNDTENASKDKQPAKNDSNHEEETYTPEDDAKIIAMKAVPGTSWNSIKEAIGKQSVSQLKDHYKLHLGPNAEAEQKKLADKIAKAEKNKVEGSAKQAEEGGKKAGREVEEKAGGLGGVGGDAGSAEKIKNKGDGGSVGAGAGAEAGADAGAGEGDDKKRKEKAQPTEEMKGSNENLEKLTKQNLQSFVKRYERDKWLAAASRHYDLTGQRISPEAAKKMAEQKGACK